jgi:hypothetical protein
MKKLAKLALPEAHYSFLSWYRNHFGLLSALRAYLDLRFNDGGRDPRCLPSFLMVLALDS